MHVRGRLVPLALVAAAAALACQGSPIALSAQKGSTVILPIGGIWEEDEGQIGFGSDIYEDPQRGDLIIKLDDENGPELVTRAVTALAAPLASQQGIEAPLTGKTDQIIVIADIPNTNEITVGPHGFFIVRRLGGVDYPGPSYAGEIQILPESITTSAGIVDGTSTPFAAIGGNDLGSTLKNVVPDPQLIFRTTNAAFAAEFEVTYPSTEVDILDVTEAILAESPVGVSTSHRAMTWWREVTPGRLAVGIVSPERRIRGVSVVFKLKATATQPIAASAAQIENARSYNANGNLITAGWSAPWIR